MNKILYGTIMCCLMCSATNAQEVKKAISVQPDAKLVEPGGPIVEGQPIAITSSPITSGPRVIYEPFTNPHQAVFVEAANLHFAGKCSSCHAATALPGSGSAFVDYTTMTGGKTTSGVSLLKPDEVTRSMLKLEDGKGIVVNGVCPTSKQLVKILKADDVILSVNGDAAVDLQKVDTALSAAGQLEVGQLELVLLRGGVEMTLANTTAYKKRADKQDRYLVGIALGELSSVVKSQLKLGDSVNVFLKQFSDNSAAKAAGLQKNDILLKVGDTPIVDPATLQKAVQNSKGKPVQIEVLRDGDQLQFSVTPTLVETPMVAVIESKQQPTFVGRYAITAPDLPNVTPMVDPRNVPNVISEGQAIPQASYRWVQPNTPYVVRQHQSIEKQLLKIEKQLERMTTVLEKLSK